MSWHGVPFRVPVEVSQGVKLAMVLYGAAILLAIFAVLCKLAAGCGYRRHGPRWRRRSRTVPARDPDGRGMLTVRERQLWDDLVARYSTGTAADPRGRGGAA